MLVLEPLELRTRDRRDDRGIGPAEHGADPFDQIAGDDVVPVRGVDHGVLERRVQGDREVRRNRPRRGRPDDGMKRLVGRNADGSRDRLVGLEANVDRRGGLVLVLDLGFGECGLTARAPVHRLESLEHHPGLEEAAERIGDRRFVVVRHGAVGIEPVPGTAETDEVLALHVDEFRREIATCPAELRGGHLTLPASELLVDLMLDREPVAIPSRNEGSVEPGHRLRANHEVLEDLVQCVADVDAAVRIGRAVVKDELRLALRRTPDGFVKPVLAPLVESFRLVDRQPRLHREVGPGQVECVFPVLRFGHQLRFRHKGLTSQRRDCVTN